MWMNGGLAGSAGREREREKAKGRAPPSSLPSFPFERCSSHDAPSLTKKCYPSVARHRTKLALPPSVPSHSSLDGDLGFHKVLRAYAANPHLAVDRRYPIVCSKFGCFGSAKVRLCVPRFLVWILSDVTSSSLLNCIQCGTAFFAGVLHSVARFPSLLSLNGTRSFRNVSVHLPSQFLKLSPSVPSHSSLYRDLRFHKFLRASAASLCKPRSRLSVQFLLQFWFLWIRKIEAVSRDFFAILSTSYRSSSLLNCTRCGILCIWTISFYTELLDFLSFSQRNTMIPEMYSRLCGVNSWIHRRRVDRVATLWSYPFALGYVNLRHSVSSLFFLPIVILSVLSSIPCSEGNLPVHFD